MKKIGRNDPCPCGAKKPNGDPIKFKRCHEGIKNEVGGMRLPGGVVLGPGYFSSDGKKSDIMTGPAIVAFDYGVANTINRLNKTTFASSVDFQSEFNSLLDNLVADTLIYLRYRLQLILGKNSVIEMSSTDAAAKEYKKASIILSTLCDFDFLVQLDRVRGRKHHSSRRYDTDYTIGTVSYDSVEKLRQLTNKVRDEVRNLDNQLNLTHPSHKIVMKQTPTSTSVEFFSIGHAMDLTKKGKIVSQNPMTSASRFDSTSEAN